MVRLVHEAMVYKTLFSNGVLRGGEKRKFETDARVVGQGIDAILQGKITAKMVRERLVVVVLSVVLGGRSHRDVVAVKPNCSRLDLSERYH